MSDTIYYMGHDGFVPTRAHEGSEVLLFKNFGYDEWSSGTCPTCHQPWPDDSRDTKRFRGFKAGSLIVIDRVEHHNDDGHHIVTVEARKKGGAIVKRFSFEDMHIPAEDPLK